MNRILCSVALVFVSFSLCSIAYAAGDPVAGKTKAALCAGCHGQDGNSPNPLFPSLAGQHPRYFIQQIRNFRNGLRGEAIMVGIAATLNNKQDLDDIAAYFASQSRVVAAKNSNAAITDGQRLYTALFQCNSCHGEGGEGGQGRIAETPFIGGLTGEYLVKELKEFRDGTRKSESNFMMDFVAKRMSDQQITTVANYVSSLSISNPEDKTEIGKLVDNR